MPEKILILDTSILCCWLRIPGKDTAGPQNDPWDFGRIDRLLLDEQKNGSTFVLPIASLIETGNHVAKCTGERFKLATALMDILLQSVQATSPWVPFTDQSALWEASKLQELARTWPALAAGSTSIGDATIKHVAEYYAKAGYAVEIMRGDQGLKAYQPIAPIPRPRPRGGWLMLGWSGRRPIAQYLFGAENPVPGIAQTRQDKAMVVESAVDGGGEDGYIGVGLLQSGDALGRGQQADELDRAGLELLQARHAGDGRVAGGQHRVDHDGVALVDPGGHFEVVLHGLQRGRVAVQADVADTGAGHHVEHAVEKAVARAQDRDQHQFLAVDHLAGHGLQRGFDLHRRQRHVARDLVCHQLAQFAQQAAKAVAAGIFPAHQRELVLDQRVGDDGEVAHIR